MPSHKKDPLYLAHASSETVPEGRLLTDYAPSTLLRAVQIMFFKGTIRHKRLPVKVDLAPYRDPAFKYDTRSAVQIFDRLKSARMNKENMRWTYKEDGAYFHATHDLDIPYDDFVRRVDISRVGDCFRDVIGINTQVLQRDEHGRSLLQVERIAALQQPNYAAFLGKDELDVYKLEAMTYEPDEVRNWMRTVCSPNASTRADDGYMAFQRRANGAGTRVEFLANQSFPLPRVMVALQLHRIVWFRNFLTRCAYRRFWGETLANMVTRYEGREFAIGRPRHAHPSEANVAVVAPEITTTRSKG
jgi:hypothetical protein